MELMVLGIAIGVILHAIYIRLFRTEGVLRIDHSNPEKDVYRFEIDKIENLKFSERMMLRIDHHAKLSQE